MRTLFALPLAFGAALAAASARADEACRRNPEPTCMADWAVALSDRVTEPIFKRIAVRVRLRLGDSAGARRLLDQLSNEGNHDASIAELAAREDRADEARTRYREARAYLDAIPAADDAVLEVYRDLAESQRRARESEMARETLRRAAERVRGELRGRDTNAAARELALVGLAMARAGDHEGARAAAADAESWATLATDALADEEALGVLLRGLRAYEIVARLRAALGDIEGPRQKLDAMAQGIEAAAADHTGRRAFLAAIALAQIAAAHSDLGGDDAARALIARAKTVLERVPADQVPNGGQALIPAYVALRAWVPALELVPAEHAAAARDPVLNYIALAQARHGALADCVATIERMGEENRGQALAEAALAATENR
jgi:hypothetical protein